MAPTAETGHTNHCQQHCQEKGRLPPLCQKAPTAFTEEYDVCASVCVRTYMSACLFCAPPLSTCYMVDMYMQLCWALKLTEAALVEKQRNSAPPTHHILFYILSCKYFTSYIIGRG